MKLAKKVFLTSLMASIAIIVVWFIVTMYVMPDHHKLANDPDNLEKITGIDFPEYTITYTDNNLNRSSSRWDCFDTYGVFNEPLPESTIAELESLCISQPSLWSKSASSDEYIYSDAPWSNYAVSCHISKQEFKVEYYADEDEGLLEFLLWIGLIFLLFVIHSIWGAILLIIYAVKKNKAKKNCQKVQDNKDSLTQA
jgi:hypothetical protein